MQPRLRLDPDKDLESAGVLGKEQHVGEHSDEVDDRTSTATPIRDDEGLEELGTPV